MRAYLEIDPEVQLAGLSPSEIDAQFVYRVGPKGGFKPGQQYTISTDASSTHVAIDSTVLDLSQGIGLVQLGRGQLLTEWHSGMCSSVAKPFDMIAKHFRYTLPATFAPYRQLMLSYTTQEHRELWRNRRAEPSGKEPIQVETGRFQIEAFADLNLYADLDDRIIRDDPPGKTLDGLPSSSLGGSFAMLEIDDRWHPLPTTPIDAARADSLTLLRERVAAHQPDALRQQVCATPVGWLDHLPRRWSTSREVEHFAKQRRAIDTAWDDWREAGRRAALVDLLKRLARGPDQEIRICALAALGRVHVLEMDFTARGLLPRAAEWGIAFRDLRPLAPENLNPILLGLRGALRDPSPAVRRAATDTLRSMVDRSAALPSCAPYGCSDGQPFRRVRTATAGSVPTFGHKLMN